MVCKCEVLERKAVRGVGLSGAGEGMGEGD